MSVNENIIAENLAAVEANIMKACQRVGRNRDDITLIVVSKTQPTNAIQSVYDKGIRVYGENKVQEILAKQPLLADDIHWHMIGHLQTNKVKQVIGKVDLIHSVDSLKLAQAIDKECQKQSCVANILVEVNIAEEDSKFGLCFDEVIPFIQEASTYSHLRICGLMTIAPFVQNSEENRDIFAQLKKLSVDITHKNIDNVTMNVLSMGMTNDYCVAIEEGATMVRIGTGIFGERK